HAGKPPGKDRLESNAGDFRNRFQASLLWMRELVQTGAHGRRVIGDVLHSLFATTTDLHEAGALRLADAVDAAARQLRFCRKIEQPVLEAGRTQIGDENFHFLKKASSTPFSG